MEPSDADTVIAARYPPKIGAALFYLEWTRMIEHGLPRHYEMHEASGRLLDPGERVTRDVVLTKFREWMVEEGYGDDCEDYVLEDELPDLSNPPREEDEGDEPVTT